jgi:hypothetical protein
MALDGGARGARITAMRRKSATTAETVVSSRESENRHGGAIAPKKPVQMNGTLVGVRVALKIAPKKSCK